MTPRTWNLAKIGCFNFLQFSWPRVHETLQKSDSSIFSNFHDLGYMKPWKIQKLQFSLIFMTPGTWNLAKIGCFNFSLIFMTSTWNLAKISIYNFLQFSWPRVHETLQKLNALVFSNFHDPGYTKPCNNGTLQFSLIFLTPRTWNLAKIECFNFL